MDERDTPHPKPKKTRAVFNAVGLMIETIDASVPHPIREFPFAPGRKWAFDMAWPDYMVAVEFEGATWQAGGGHNSGAGYRSDIDKYNAAAIYGWCLIRITADMLRDRSYIRPIFQALAAHGYEFEDDSIEPPNLEEEPVPAKDYWADADTGGVIHTG